MNPKYKEINIKVRPQKACNLLARKEVDKMGRSEGGHGRQREVES